MKFPPGPSLGQHYSVHYLFDAGFGSQRPKAEASETNKAIPASSSWIYVTYVEIALTAQYISKVMLPSAAGGTVPHERALGRSIR